MRAVRPAAAMSRTPETITPTLAMTHSQLQTP